MFDSSPPTGWPRTAERSRAKPTSQRLEVPCDQFNCCFTIKHYYRYIFWSAVRLFSSSLLEYHSCALVLVSAPVLVFCKLCVMTLLDIKRAHRWRWHWRLRTAWHGWRTHISSWEKISSLDWWWGGRRVGSLDQSPVTRCWNVQQMSMVDDSKLKLWGFFLLCIMIRIIFDYKGTNRLHVKSITSEIRHLMNIDVGRLLHTSTVAQRGQNDFNINFVLLSPVPRWASGAKTFINVYFPPWQPYFSKAPAVWFLTTCRCPIFPTSLYSLKIFPLLSLAVISDPGRRRLLSHRVYNRSEEQ